MKIGSAAVRLVVVSMLVACGATGEIALGEDSKGLMAARDVEPARDQCGGGTAHPNVCCRGEACYVWLDDPFRRCEFGFTAIPDGTRCCSPNDRTCTTTHPTPARDAGPPVTDAGPWYPTVVDGGPWHPPAIDAGGYYPPVADGGRWQPPVPPVTPPGWKLDGGTWLAYAFSYDRAQSTCAGGARYVQFSPRYGKWVGVELCSPTRYKIFLGDSMSGVYHEIGDFAGHGQDHCELVNPWFTIPNEDDVTSGSCASCNVEMAGWDRPGDVPVYSRSTAGTGFELQTWPEHNLYTSSWYECGVSIP